MTDDAQKEKEKTQTRKKEAKKYYELQLVDITESSDSTDRQPVGERADDRAEAPAGGLCRTTRGFINPNLHEKP